MADTRTRILDLAQDAIQKGGYRAFSFRDLADTIDVKPAAIHYHFRHKDDLGLAIVDRYRSDFFAALSEHDRESAPDRLRAMASLFGAPLQEEKICLCAAVIADSSIVSDDMRSHAGCFFSDLATWLVNTIAQGMTDGSLRSDLATEDTANEFLSLLYGGMLVGRAQQNPAHLQAVSDTYIKSLLP